MKGSSTPIPQSLRRKLKAIQHRELRVRFLEGTLRTAAVFVAAMLVAMAIDWMVGWFNPAARLAITAAALTGTGVALVAWILKPFIDRRNLVETAAEVDQFMPELQERWSTVTEYSENKDAPEFRGSEELLNKVSGEANDFDIKVSPEQVISSQGVSLAGRWLAGGIAVLALAFLVNFSQAWVLAKRFVLPGANISLTRIDPISGNQVVPMNEPLTLKAAISGRLRSDSTQIYLRDEEGTEEVALMTPSTKEDEAGTFDFAKKSVANSFDYRIRAGDGQTDWHSVTAVERPRLTEVQVRVQPPAYSKLPLEEKDSLPYRLRILEGSDMQVRFRTDQKLEEMKLEFAEDESLLLQSDDGEWFEFSASPTNNFSFTAVLINEFQLENKNKPTCRVSVYEDLAPAVRVLEPSDDLAAQPDETIDIVFEAQDDFGIAKAELIVTTRSEGEEAQETIIPIDIGGQAETKKLREAVELDLSQFDLQQGDELSYVVQVTDTKQNPGIGQFATSNSESQESQEPTPQEADNAGENEPQLAQEESTEPSETQPSSASQNATPAMAAAKPNDDDSQRPQNQNPSPPPNEMAMRQLDVPGQCAACKPRNIKIDEWAGEFDGERREKQEMAINEVLERLKQLLEKAQAYTDSLVAISQDNAGLTNEDSETLGSARNYVRDAIDTVLELKRKSAGSPYTFMGLQLDNVSESHVKPAQTDLKEVSTENEDAKANEKNLNSPSFHIQRAREMLAELTETYESIKREQKIADAMQQLSKMYQVFLEDTQALLGGKKPPINQYDRKIAEVDDEFVERLKEFLEEKKRIMAELADLLAEDPRMLRRYMAWLELQGTSYRDQMTLLAERQKDLRDQIARWNMAPEEERADLLVAFQAFYANEQKTLLTDANQMYENMETWLPLEVDPDHELARKYSSQAAQLVSLSGETLSLLAGEELEPAIDKGHSVLGELRNLHEGVPELNTLEGDADKISIFVANRLEEIEKLISQQSGLLKTLESLSAGNYHAAAEITQHRLAQDTETLSEKLVTVESQVSSMSDEIREAAEELNRIVSADLVFPQTVATENLHENEMESAAVVEDQIVMAFNLAEDRFDELMRLIIAKLDEAPAPSGGGGSPQSLEDILDMLENEMKAAENLGIPCRPINVSIMKDWMQPGQQQGMGAGAAAMAQARAAQARAQQAMEQADRLQREANERAKELAAKFSKGAGGGGKGDGEGPEAPVDAWNKLASKLEKDLLQSRDNTPPEQYRKAIEQYFKTIADQIPSANP